MYSSWFQFFKPILIENLTIDKEDFEYMPIFERVGGLAKARKIFKNKLDELIIKLNAMIAA